MSACETFPEGLPQALDTGSTDRYWRWKLQDSSDLNHFLPTLVDDSLEQFWRKAVRIYTSCGLTNGSDKLIAIWGIARFLISALKETYGVGLWERNLEEQLAWRVVHGQQGHERPTARPEPLRAPTWSWMSIDGIIDLPDRFSAVRDYQVVGHYGGPIAFMLAGETQKGPDRSGPRTWTEQLKVYESRLKKLDEDRKRSGLQAETIQSGPTPPDTKPQFDAVPGLFHPWIRIWGHIGRANLHRTASGLEWTLDLNAGSPLQVHEGAIIAAYPDLDPEQSVEWKAASSVSGSSSANKVQWETTYLILAMNMFYSETLQRRAPTYSGIGLLIQHTGRAAFFSRTGAFRFSGLSLRPWQGYFDEHIDAFGLDPYGYDQNRGHKIWLL